MKRQRAATSAPGTRLVVAMAPEFTMGLVRPSALASMPANELKARPVALAPTAARNASHPMDWQTSAMTKGLETLMIEKG